MKSDRTPFQLVIGGDAILNRQISVCRDERFLAIAKLFQAADIAFVNCETVIHNYEGPETYPSAQAAATWMRSPFFVADEFKWMGINLVALANNHMLDYSYGGLFSTCDALASAGIAFAGAGRDLAAARAAAYVDTDTKRVSLVSMTSSFADGAPAGYSHDGISGRPGINPLRFHQCVDRATLAQIIDLAKKIGWWIAQVKPDEWEIHPPGLQNTVTRYFVSDEPGLRTLVNERDALANLHAIRNARAHSDLVIAHLHGHEWEPNGDLSSPPTFVPPFARACIDAGTDVFICQGSHAQMRGIEIYSGKPIFYDPGDLFLMSSSVTRFPREYYERRSATLGKPAETCLPVDGHAARWDPAYSKPMNPPRGYGHTELKGGVVPILAYDSDGVLASLELHPYVPLHSPFALSGLPARAHGETARKLIERLLELSQTFATKIDFDGEIGRVRLERSPSVSNTDPPSLKT